MSVYWLSLRRSDYCWDDQLNEAIWSKSVAVQRLIQDPQELCEEGCFGAQQAMVDGQAVRPWPPDLLGADWSKPGSLLIIGSAYAGFIREFSGRSASMLLRDYDPTLPCSKFQERFLRDVVAEDSVYYGGLAMLLTNVLPVKSVATFDLCRASFVKRVRLNPRKRRSGRYRSRSTWSKVFGDMSRTRRAGNRRSGSGEESLLARPPLLSCSGLLRNMDFCGSPANAVWQSKSLAKDRSKFPLN
jgi:hypothetical protein